MKLGWFFFAVGLLGLLVFYVSYFLGVSNVWSDFGKNIFGSLLFLVFIGALIAYWGRLARGREEVRNMERLQQQRMSVVEANLREAIHPGSGVPVDERIVGPHGR